MKFLCSVILILNLLFVPVVFAQESTTSANPSADFFTIFWPLSAGRTVGEPLYFVKTIREEARRLLIFGDAPRASYDLELVIKRVLEVQKLNEKGKAELAASELNRAKSRLDLVVTQLERAKNNEEVLGPDKKDFIKRSEGLIKYIEGLIATSNSNKEQLNNMLLKAKEANSMAEKL